MVQRKTKYIQDAAEKYAVYLMEKILEDRGVSLKRDSQQKWQDYINYLDERNLEESDINKSDYVTNCKRQLPVFISGVVSKFPNQKFSVFDVEKENRNQNKKADFDIHFMDKRKLSFSLKNYAGGIDRPQVRAGTFNSLVMNLLFESPSVGMYVYEVSGTMVRFKGSNVSKRNYALKSIGLPQIIEDLEKLDKLQEEARKTVLEDPSYEMFDEHKWKSLCVQIGSAGAKTMHDLCRKLNANLIAKKLLGLAGFAGEEEVLFISPNQILDSLTNDDFRTLKLKLRNSKTVMNYKLSGQTLIFEYWLDGKRLLRIDVPFTLNRNGAYWLDLPVYSGTRKIKDKKHIVELRWGERRPYKSRELATSINTYVDLKSTGIFN